MPTNKNEEGRGDLLDKPAKTRLLKEFVTAYLNGDIAVDTTKTVKVNARDKLMREKPKPPSQYETARERFEWENEISAWTHKLGDVGYTKIVEEKVEDSRFINLAVHIDKYAGVMPYGDITAEEREKVGRWLSGMILLLKKEKRIKGELRLQPHRDAEIERLNKRMDNFEKRLGSTNRIVERIATGR